MKRAIAVIALAACGAKRPPGQSGRLAAAGLIAGVKAAAAEQAPWRCARGPATPLALTHDLPFAIAVVADAHAPSDATLTALRGFKDAFTRAQVAAVFTAGGMGTAEPDLERTLGALTDPGWTVVAIPGDREDVAALRAAVAALHGKGGAIVDGTRTRAVDLGAVKLATIPGEAFAARLAAGAGGCTRDRADLDAALATLGPNAATAKPAPMIAISATAPRTNGASDVAPGGVHAGELDLAAALAAHPVDLIVHPQLGAPSPAGKLDPGAMWPSIAIATGTADAAPRFDDAGKPLAPGALIVTVDRSGIRWQPIGATTP
jgi:hypothetical protein